MKKKTLVILIVLILILAGLCFLNRENLEKYFANKEWEIAETSGSVELENYYTIDGTYSNFIVIGNNYLRGYSDATKENFDESVSLKDAVSSSDGDYCVVGENNGSKIYMISSNAKLWETEVQGTIHGVTVNKNGYSAIIYKQTGYKTLIKVLSPKGEEIFTSYLASTYAIDAEISNDNKLLAIAEINAEGIAAGSSVKIIDINKLEQNNISVTALDDDSLITNIEYTNKNELLIQTNKNIRIISEEGLKNLSKDFDSNVYFASIENSEKPIIISKLENGLFDTKYKVGILNTAGEEVEYTLEKLPTIIKAQKNNIAVVLDNQLLVINTSGRLVKRYEFSESVKDICFFENGDAIAIIHRDTIEFIKNI